MATSSTDERWQAAAGSSSSSQQAAAAMATSSTDEGWQAAARSGERRQQAAAAGKAERLQAVVRQAMVSRNDKQERCASVGTVWTVRVMKAVTIATPII